MSWNCNVFVTFDIDDVIWHLTMFPRVRLKLYNGGLRLSLAIHGAVPSERP